MLLGYKYFAEFTTAKFLAYVEILFFKHIVKEDTVSSYIAIPYDILAKERVDSY